MAERNPNALFSSLFSLFKGGRLSTKTLVLAAVLAVLYFLDISPGEIGNLVLMGGDSQSTVASSGPADASKTSPESSEATKKNVPGRRVSASVSRIVDGDTIRVVFGDGTEDVPVRLIGIDTPESRRNNRAELQSKESEKTVDEIVAMGKAASKHMSSILSKGDRVQLEFDAGEKDKYGRYLAYVWKGEEMVNSRMVADGYASLLTIAPNVKYANLFRTLYAEAREAKRGLWKE